MTWFEKSLAVIGALSLSLAGCGGIPQSEIPVVGLGSSETLFEDAKREKASGKVEPGTALSVLSTENQALKVKTHAGKEGWIRRFAVCTTAEYERRKAKKQFPKNVICMGSRDGKTFMYGGSLSIRNGRPSTEAGDAFWMDPTMKGVEFNFGSEKIKGDPDVLLLTPESGEMIRLAVWTPPLK